MFRWDKTLMIQENHRTEYTNKAKFFQYRTKNWVLEQKFVKITWKWRFFQVLTVQEKAETNQIDKKVKYRKERGRYASSIPMPFSPRLSGASMITPNCWKSWNNFDSLSVALLLMLEFYTHTVLRGTWTVTIVVPELVIAYFSISRLRW